MGNQAKLKITWII